MRNKNLVIVFAILFVNVVVLFAQDNKTNICEKIKGLSKIPTITSLPYRCVDEIYLPSQIMPPTLFQNFCVLHDVEMYAVITQVICVFLGIAVVVVRVQLPYR